MGAAATSLLLGLLSTASPCVLPLYPGFLAYLSGQDGLGRGWRRFALGPAVLAGVLSMMLALGALIAALAVSVGRVLLYAVPLADAVILVMGALLLAGRNPLRALPQVRVPLLRRPLLNAYVYGLLYGPLTLPCSGPLVVSIFALSLTAGEALGTLWAFLWFGAGFGAPLLLLSLLSGALQRRLAALFARRARLLDAAAGLLLIGVASYDLWQSWAFIRLLVR